MSSDLNFDELRRDLHWLRGEDGVVSEAMAVDRLAKLLTPLLATEGLQIARVPHGPEDRGVDLEASTASGNGAPRVRLGIEYKHRGQGQPIGVDAVRALLGAATSGVYERLMLIGRFGFSRAARELARTAGPVELSLRDLRDLDEWIRTLESKQTQSSEQVHLLIRTLSDEFARLVARDPSVLDHLEWRDLERMMARVMEGLGFRTTLTPPSKDGGKDLILVCQATSGEHSYIVELKHWRAGKRVGKGAVTDFLQVVVAEGRTAGLFLSTSGFVPGALEGLTEISRQRIRAGDQTKIVSLAQSYVRNLSGLWFPTQNLPELLFEGTYNSV